jgi:hypothetical protein
MPSSAFTILFPSHQIDRLVDRPLRLVPGGHNANSTFPSRLGPGDVLYPVAVERGELYVLARMPVAAKVRRDDHLREHPEDAPYFTQGCGGWAAVGTAEATSLRLDVVAPAPLVEAFRFRSPKQGERAIKHLKDGRITHTIAFHGVYEITDATRALLDALIYAATD